MRSEDTNQPELLAPAGNFEKLEIAIHFGADAVYLAGKEFSLRNFSGNFTPQEMQKAILLAHEHGVNVYVTCNTFSRNHEQQAISEFIASLGKLHPDGVIISDPGTLALSQQLIPEIPVHLSTQANTTNYLSAGFWKKQGVKRINVARELHLSEIERIARETDIEIEAFVHGAMCMAYSGRCLMSNFMAGRDSNRGMCCHPCRYNYTVVEEKRPGQYYDIQEDALGSYIFSSKDLCMIEHLPDMIQAGIDTLKIEGRMKGINYLATVVKTYREAIDAYTQNPSGYTVKTEWLAELAKVSHRGYCTGFYMGDPSQVSPSIQGPTNPSVTILAKVNRSLGNGFVSVDVRGQIHIDDTIEILSNHGPLRNGKVLQMIDHNGQGTHVVNPGVKAEVVLDCEVVPNDILRKAAQ